MAVPDATELQTADWDGVAGDELVGLLLTIRQGNSVDTFDADGALLFHVSSEHSHTDYTDVAWADLDGDGVEELYIAENLGIEGSILAYSPTGELVDGMGPATGWVEETYNHDLLRSGVASLDALPATADQPGVLLGVSLYEPFVVDSELSEVSRILPEHPDIPGGVGASLPIRGPDGQPMWAFSVDEQLEFYDSKAPTTPVWSTDAMDEDVRTYLSTRSSAWLSRGSWDGSPVISHLVEDGFAVVDIHGTPLASYALGGDAVWNRWEDHGPHSFQGMDFVHGGTDLLDDAASQEQGLAVLRDGRLEYFER